MKSGSLPKGFPASQADWEKLIAEAPGDDRPPTSEEAATWANAIMTLGGGPDACLAEIRRVRGPQKSPKKVATAIRLSPEVVDYFKAAGPGWQTRVDSALQEYVKAHKD